MPLAAALCVSALLAGCVDSEDSGVGAEAAAAEPSTAASPAASPTRTSSPGRVLPVTPVAPAYTLADPGFEALPGARAYFGEYKGGIYQIEVPDQWNGEIVYYAHGYRMNLPVLEVFPPPIREHLIERGYAWAASSFTHNGYEPGIAANDTIALREVVASTIGTPRRNYLYGQSMGGHIVALLLEQHPNLFDGAMAECGAVAGNQILDYFLSWGLLAGYFSDIDMSASALDADSFGRAVSDAIFPALGTADHLTPRGEAFASVVERLTGGPRPYFREGFLLSYPINFGILGGAITMPGHANAAAQNAHTEYTIAEGFGVTAAEINRDVPRVDANPVVRQDPARYPEFADMTGRIADPMITLHNTGDLFVPISAEQEYRRRAVAAGAGDLLVQRAIRRTGHCVFSHEELVRAFDDLTAWVERGVRPAGDDLLAPLEDAGLEFTQPLEPDDPALQTAR